MLYYSTPVSLVILCVCLSVCFCSPGLCLVTEGVREPAAAVGALAPVLVSSRQWWLMSGHTWTHHAPLHPLHSLNIHTCSQQAFLIYCLLILYLAVYLKVSGSSTFSTHFLSWSYLTLYNFLEVLWVCILNVIYINQFCFYFTLLWWKKSILPHGCSKSTRYS